ncbi:MAG: phosphoribosyltransferase [Chitinophagia bacterium]|nr:phosphoribosyltransferase [Chitinophagia bacterium]
MNVRKTILTREQTEQKMQRMALELAEKLSGDSAPLIIMGIKKNGEVIAQQIAQYLKQYIPNSITLVWAQMDKSHPTQVEISEPIDFTGKHVLITDDVTNSGRTLLYAVKPLLDSHPLSIQTLVLVERMHKQFPVKADYVGLSVATTLQEHIQVTVDAGVLMGAFME